MPCTVGFWSIKALEENVGQVRVFLPKKSFYRRRKINVIVNHHVLLFTQNLKSNVKYLLSFDNFVTINE